MVNYIVTITSSASSPKPGTTLTANVVPTPSLPATYQWYLESTTVGGPTASATLVTNAAGNYIVELVDSEGRCKFSRPFAVECYSYTATLTGTASPTAPLAGDTLVATVTPPPALPATYSWWLDNVLLAGQSNATLVTTQAGLYGVTVVDAYGCQAATSTPPLAVQPAHGRLVFTTTTSVDISSSIPYVLWLIGAGGSAGTDGITSSWGGGGGGQGKFTFLSATSGTLNFIITSTDTKAVFGASSISVTAGANEVGGTCNPTVPPPFTLLASGNGGNSGRGPINRLYGGGGAGGLGGNGGTGAIRPSAPGVYGVNGGSGTSGGAGGGGVGFWNLFGSTYISYVGNGGGVGGGVIFASSTGGTLPGYVNGTSGDTLGTNGDSYNGDGGQFGGGGGNLYDRLLPPGSGAAIIEW